MTATETRSEEETRESLRQQLAALVIPAGGAHAWGAKWVPYDPQSDVEPFDVQTDWEERA